MSVVNYSIMKAFLKTNKDMSGFTEHLRGFSHLRPMNLELMDAEHVHDECKKINNQTKRRALDESLKPVRPLSPWRKG
jgi:hypothetical protein